MLNLLQLPHYNTLAITVCFFNPVISTLPQIPSQVLLLNLYGRQWFHSGGLFIVGWVVQAPPGYALYLSLNIMRYSLVPPLPWLLGLPRDAIDPLFCRSGGQFPGPESFLGVLVANGVDSSLERINLIYH